MYDYIFCKDFFSYCKLREIKNYEGEEKRNIGVWEHDEEHESCGL